MTPLANEALAAFWASVTIGRLPIASSGRWARFTYLYLVLPWLTAGSLLLVPLARTAATGLFAFAFARSAAGAEQPRLPSDRRRLEVCFADYVKRLDHCLDR